MFAYKIHIRTSLIESLNISNQIKENSKKQVSSHGIKVNYWTSWSWCIVLNLTAQQCSEENLFDQNSTFRINKSIMRKFWSIVYKQDLQLCLWWHSKEYIMLYKYTIFSDLLLIYLKTWAKISSINLSIIWLFGYLSYA